MATSTIGMQIEIAAEGGDPNLIARKLLDAAGLSSARVKDFVPLKGGNPVMSQVFRVRICGGARAPRSVVLKLPARSRGDRVREAGNASYRREVEVYRLLCDMQGGFQPRILAEHFDPDSGTSALLIEDLGALPSRTEFTIDVIEAALSGLAKIHSRFWNDVRIGTCAWIRNGYRADIFDEDTEQFAPNWDALRSSSALHPCRSPAVNAVGSFLTKQLIGVLDALEERPRTLCHGDLHIENMLLRRNRGTTVPVLIDWQDAVFGGASSDIAKFLSTTLSVEFAASHFEELISFFYRALGREIQSNYSLPAFRRDVMLALLATFANYVICSTTEESEGIDTATLNKSLRSVSRVIDAVRPLDAI